VLVLLTSFSSNINAQTNGNRTEAQTNMNNNQSLDAKQQSIVTTSAFTAKGDLENLRTALNRGLDAGLTD